MFKLWQKANVICSLITACPSLRAGASWPAHPTQRPSTSSGSRTRYQNPYTVYPRQCCGSGIPRFFDPWSGSWISFCWFRDFGSWIPHPYSSELGKNLLSNFIFIFCQLTQIFSVPAYIKNYFLFCK
jgi:hypothetical protein